MTVYDLQRYMERGEQIIKLLGNDRTMRYLELSCKIGLVAADGWQVQHRTEISKVLYGIASQDRYSGAPMFHDSDL
jgi:hypothetical protein